MSGKQWFCKIGDREIGPLTGQELAEMARSGQLRRDDEIRKGNDHNWIPASNVQGLLFGLASTPPSTATDETSTKGNSTNDHGNGSQTVGGLWDSFPKLSGTPKELQAFWAVLGISVVVACLTIFASPPTETGWWIFKAMHYPFQMLVAAAVLLTSGYLFILTKWYSDADQQFRCVPSIQAFLLCGGVSILLCLFVYPVWNVISSTEVKGWFFNSVEYRNPLFAFMDRTGVIAGPIEELAKFVAILLVVPVRKLIKDRKSGLFYVTLCAFGFAMIENITYFHAFNGVLFLRANPAHAVFSSVWGAAYGSWVAGKASAFDFSKWLLFGMGLHSLWNLCVGLNVILFVICFVFTSWMGMQFIRNELRSQATGG